MDYPLRLTDQLRAHLRALRKQRGLTQAQLGQRLGLSQVRIAEIEAKPGLVSVDQLVRILSALGATLVLRDQAGSGAEATPVPAAAAPQPIVKAVRAKTPVARAPGSAPRKPRPRAAGASPPPAIKPNKGSW